MILRTDDFDDVYTAFRLYVTLQEDKARVGRARKLLDEALGVQERSIDRYGVALRRLSEAQRGELTERVNALPGGSNG
jgi:hypothetical protein